MAEEKKKISGLELSQIMMNERELKGGESDFPIGHPMNPNTRNAVNEQKKAVKEQVRRARKLPDASLNEDDRRKQDEFFLKVKYKIEKDFNEIGHFVGKKTREFEETAELFNDKPFLKKKILRLKEVSDSYVRMMETMIRQINIALHGEA